MPVRHAAGHPSGPARVGADGARAGGLPGRNKNRTIKLTYQVSGGQKLVGFFTRNPFDEDKARADRYIPYETTLKLNQTGMHGKVEWNGAFGNRLLATTMLGGQNPEESNILHPGRVLYRLWRKQDPSVRI